MAERKCRDKTRSGNSYHDRHDAQVAANRINGRRLAGKARRNPVEPYPCQHCGRWHVGKGRLTRHWESANHKREG